MGLSVIVSFTGKHRRRGIYFISTLAVVTFVSFLITAAIFSVRGNLGASRHLTTGDTAQKAAESGLRYAQSKLCANPAWRGDDNRITIDDPDLVVEEQDGNVIGIIRGPGGGYAQFRLRFNWQDGTQNDTDDFDDPPDGARIGHRYVSVNNIVGGSSMDVPRADEANFSVTSDSRRDYSIPSGSACIIVEGRVGSGLGALSPSNLNPPLSPGGVVTRVVEANFRIGEQPGADAALMAAGEVTTELSDGVFEVDAKSGVPRVRSKKKVTVKGGDAEENFVSDKGEVHTSDGQLHASPGSMAKANTSVEDANAGFYKLEWEDVRKAQPGDSQLSAGTYVVWDDGSIHYYDMGYKKYVTFIEQHPNNPGSVVDLGSNAALATKFEDGEKKLLISDNVLITATAKTDEFNLIPRKGAQEDPEAVGQTQTTAQMADDVLSSLNREPSNKGPLAGASGGMYAANWEVPISGSIEGGEIRVETGTYAFGTWHGIVLKEISPGVGVLIVDSGDQANLFTPPIHANPLGALSNGLKSRFSGDPNLAPLLFQVLGGSSGMRELDLDSGDQPVSPAQPKMSADDITVEFQPKGGASAILSADGDINIAGKVKGTGGSITTAGNLRFVGAGTDLAATLEDGLNLYAKGDITLSSLRSKNDGTYDYKDFKLKGVIYTWGDFQAKVGFDEAMDNWGEFSLEGALVAYGSKNQASLGDPGDGQGGAINIKAEEVNLTFDPAYLVALQKNVGPGRVKQTFFTTY